MQRQDKPLVWLSDSVKSPPFSRKKRLEAGMMLRTLQRGETIPFPQSRPMPAIGKHCHELRIPDQEKTWRIIYRLDTDAIVIVEVFAKKTARTPRKIIDNAKLRLQRYDSESS